MLPVYLVMLVLLLIVLLLRKAPALYDNIFCKVFSKVFSKVYSIQKLKNFLDYNLFWNSTFKYIIEGYLALTLESLTLINKGLDWTTSLN